MNIAVLHEAAFEYGGGMRVVDCLGEKINADIFIGFANDEAVAKSTNKPRVLSKKEIEGKRRAVESMIKFPLISLRDYDIVIESGSGTHWYLPRGGQKIIRYVHSVPLSYKSNNTFDVISRKIRKPTIKTADAYVANSEQTSKEIEKHLNRKSTVIYPPVAVSKFSPNAGTGFVTISRLTERKGVKEIVELFNSRDEKLTVVGSGPLLDDLRQISEKNIHITGWVDEETKVNILRDGGAFILNSGNESFGISPVEALASGMPVIARDGGYTPNQVVDGFNGILFDSLEEGINRYVSEGVGGSVSDMVKEAQKYSQESFVINFERVINEVT